MVGAAKVSEWSVCDKHHLRCTYVATTMNNIEIVDSSLIITLHTHTHKHSAIYSSWFVAFAKIERKNVDFTFDNFNRIDFT